MGRPSVLPALSQRPPHGQMWTVPGGQVALGGTRALPGLLHMRSRGARGSRCTPCPVQHRYTGHLPSKLPASAPQHTHTYTHTTHSHHTHAPYTHPPHAHHTAHTAHTAHTHRHTAHTLHTHIQTITPAHKRSISNHPTQGTQPANLPGRRGVNLITGLVCLPPGWENINTSRSLGGREQGGEELF